MIDRILAAVLAAAIFLGVGGYTLASLNERSLALAEISRDICYSRHGISPGGAPAPPEPIMRECTQPIRDYQASWIWRWVFAAAAGATAAVLIAGGIVIVRRRRRRQPAVPLGRSGH
jgi:ABC-type branched-subunit amino acid transport system permease subunit